MAETTERIVQTRFVAIDGGHEGVVTRLANRMQFGAEKVAHLQNRFADFRREQGFTTLAALGLGAGIGAWIVKAKEANAEFGRTQKSIAGVLTSALDFNKGTTEIERYTQAAKLAHNITEELDETSARFVMPLEDVAGAYRGMASAAGMLGLTQKQTMELTVEAVATAKRFGVGGEQAVSAISRALQTGSVRGFDPFNNALRTTLGNMKKLTEAQRFEHIQKALKGSVDIADAMSQGIGGSLARIRNIAEDTIRDISSPVFANVAKRLDGWAKSLREARENGKPLIDEVADKLVVAFDKVAETTKFIREHWVAIAGVMGGLKVSNMLATGGSLAGLGGMGGGKIGEFGSKLAGATIALGAFKLALDGLLDVIEKKIDAGREKTIKSASTMGDLSVIGALAKNYGPGGFDTRQMAMTSRRLADLEKAGLVGGNMTTGRTADPTAIRRLLASDLDQAKDLGGRFGVKLEPQFPVRLQAQLTELTTKLTSDIGSLINVVGQKSIAAPASLDSLRFTKAPVFNFHGGIKIENKFEDQDPDRNFVVFQRKFEDYVGQRTQSAFSEHLGE